MKKRAGIYVRVSTSDKQNPEIQLKTLSDYACNRGLQIIGEFIDRAKGSLESRPGLDGLMDIARKRALDVILVFRFDRFGRSIKHLINVLDEFQRLEIDFVSYQENIDTRSPAGRVLYALISAFASFEREILAERVRHALSHAKSQGVRLGRPPASSEICEKIVSLRRQSYTMSKISRTLQVSKGLVHKTLKKSQM